MAMLNEDFKYYMQDMSKIYLGASLSYDEILENEEIPFKLKAIISHYLLKEADSSMSIAEHILKMDSKSFSYMTFHQLKIKVKVTYINLYSNKKGKKIHVNKVITLEELIADKEIHGESDNVFLEEIMISKISLMSFSV
ncbi:MAG TPA: hypothetical protein VJZ04_11360 [Lachnospiraceae bacterium]|nr:hypothetical protein [Lachnospiraceae bacterium]